MPLYYEVTSKHSLIFPMDCSLLASEYANKIFIWSSLDAHITVQ